jgi:hypothetical protein
VGRDKRGGTAARDGTRFALLPHVVLDSRAYLGLSAPAKALLVEMARQFHGHNNGALLCSRSKLAPRGWTSNDTLTRAKKELLNAGLLFETVAGQRPNKASWYALTWLNLDRLDGYDAGAAHLFQRGAYRSHDERKPVAKTQPLHRQTVQEAPE